MAIPASDSIPTSSNNTQNLNSINDPLYVASSDHPGMILTNTPFNGGNFHGWSRTIKMALGAKLKLGFIDGSCIKPVDDVEKLQRWIRCDYMVTCWILNSMVTDLSEAFLYAQLAFELWKEIEERYGQSNGPLIYQLERELSQVTHGNLSIAAYFNKLKKCWDELHNLNGVPVCTCEKMRECTCGIVDKFLKIEGRSKLFQFLMKLNDEYESVRNQILSMDPLPNVNKAYYIVQQIEKQKQVTTHMPDPTAFFANMNAKHIFTGKKDFKASKAVDGRKHCTYCDRDRNYEEQCFEKLGYLDWYKGKRGKKGNKLAARVDSYYDQETPFDLACENGIGMGQNAGNGVDQRLVDAAGNDENV